MHAPCETREDPAPINAGVGVRGSRLQRLYPQVKNVHAAVTSTGDLDGLFFSSPAFCADGCPSLPSVSAASNAAPQQLRNCAVINLLSLLSSLHAFVAVWQRNHLFPVDGSVAALHTNRVHCVAGGDTSSFTHLGTFVFGKITSLWKRWHPGQWVLA